MYSDLDVFGLGRVDRFPTLMDFQKEILMVKDWGNIKKTCAEHISRDLKDIFLVKDALNRIAELDVLRF